MATRTWVTGDDGWRESVGARVLACVVRDYMQCHSARTALVPYSSTSKDQSVFLGGTGIAHHPGPSKGF